MHFNGDMDIDADGAYHAYHPDNTSGLDDLRNAHTGDDWFGCVTVGGRPVIQGPAILLPAFTSRPPRPPPAARRHGLSKDEPAGLRGRGISAIHRGASRHRERRGWRGARMQGTPHGHAQRHVGGLRRCGYRPEHEDRRGVNRRGEGARHPVQRTLRRRGETGIHVELWPGVAAVVNGVTYPLQHS